MKFREHCQIQYNCLGKKKEKTSVLGPHPNKLYPIFCGDIIVFMVLTLTEALVSAQCMQCIDGNLLTRFLDDLSLEEPPGGLF